MTETVSAKLQGRVVGIEETGDKRDNVTGALWKKCIFTVEITNFSMRTADMVVPKEVEGKKVKLVRWCCYHWHYKLNVRKTLSNEETEAVLKGTPSTTVLW